MVTALLLACPEAYSPGLSVHRNVFSIHWLGETYIQYENLPRAGTRPQAGSLSLAKWIRSSAQPPLRQRIVLSWAVRYGSHGP